MATKKEQAQNIYNNMVAQGASNDDIIAKFMSELNMTQAGATTYRYNCAKAAKGSITSTPTSKASTAHSKPITRPSKQVESSNDGDEGLSRERIDTRPLYTACIIDEDIILQTFSYYEKQDALHKSSFVLKSPSELVPEINSRWSKVPQKYHVTA